jgi:hypothetical protein
MGSHIQSLEGGISDMQKKLSGSYLTRLLRGSEEFFGTLNKLIAEDSKLDVTYFSAFPPTELVGIEVAKYWKALARNLKRCDHFRVRRIVTIESEIKLQWVRQTLGDSGTALNYHLAVLTTEQSFPLLNVVIVDGRYSAIFEPHAQSTDSTYIFIDDRETARALQRYFDDLWRVAVKLKVGKQIYLDAFATVESRLSQHGEIGTSAQKKVT